MLAAASADNAMGAARRRQRRARSGFFTHSIGRLRAARRWGHLDDGVGGGRADGYCRSYCSVLGPLQTVQRAEFWCVVLALQASDATHLGVDNLNVVRQVGRLLDGVRSSRPAELTHDRVLQQREKDTVCVTKVKGHAVEAAEFGRCRVDLAVIDARRNLSGVCRRWYPIHWELHRFFIANSRVVAKHDGGEGIVRLFGTLIGLGFLSSVIAEKFWRSTA